MPDRPPFHRAIRDVLPRHRAVSMVPRDRRRYMTPQWRRTRLRVLTRDGHCQDPSGCAEPCTECDHVIPVAQGGTDDEDNLQGLCRRHHGLKTRYEDQGRVRPGETEQCDF